MLTIEMGRENKECLVYVSAIEEEAKPKQEYIDRINNGIGDWFLAPWTFDPSVHPGIQRQNRCSTARTLNQRGRSGITRGCGDPPDERHVWLDTDLLPGHLAPWLSHRRGFVCFVQLRFGSKEKWLITLILTAGLWAFVYLLFDRVLHVPFPTGYLFKAIGLAE